ncbi:unnamed protein product [Caenorhabditis angaria]|uniref:Uncharacterized protein n=1 Tax=Caenorhabditis angaria TaxID=860376 RepID=A0A9P1J2V2_9PELO|nr:unnamed protein product [Caenorhabditis angaria]
MAITRAGLFTLETSNPRFYTLCGLVHIKIAFGLIVLFFMIMEAAEWLVYITVDDIGEQTTWLDSLLSILQLIMVICMALAFVTENPYLIIPFILFMFLTISSLLIWVFKAVVWVFTPYSAFVSSLFRFDENTPLSKRETRILFFLAMIVTAVTFLSSWLHTALVCYQYFESRANEKKQKKANASAPLPQLVVPGTNQKVTPTSFNNQNFSISDEEEDEDNKVFEQKKNGPDMV